MSNFNLHDFVMKTIKGMIGNEIDYKVRQYALGWINELTPEDMEAIDAMLEPPVAAEQVNPEV